MNTRCIDNDLLILDSILNNTTNLNPEAEDQVLALVSECKKIYVNTPEAQLSRIVAILQSLIKLLDISFVNINSLETEVSNLQSNVLLLKDKLDSEKEARITVLNDSFGIQDLAIMERNKLQDKITQLQEKLKVSQFTIRNLTIDNKSINDHIDVLKYEIDSYKLKISELEKFNKSLAESIKSHKPNISTAEWNKSRWVDDSLLQTYFDECQSSVSHRNDVLMIGPSVAQFIKLNVDLTEVSEQLKQLSVDNKRFIFICVSDSTEGFSDDSGSHWSLLLIDNSERQAFHFDSAQGFNFKHALKILSRFGIDRTKCIELPCSQQKNNFECGINVLFNLKLVLHCYVLKSIQMPLREWYSDFVNITTLKPEINQSKLSVPKLVLRKHSNDEWSIAKPKYGSKSRARTVDNIVTIYNSFAVLDEELASVSSSVCSSVDYSPIKSKSMKQNPKSKVSPLPSKGSRPNGINVVSKTPKVKDDLPSPGTRLSSKDNKTARLALLSDSHGRNLHSLLDSKLEHSFSVFASVKPNGTFKNVIEGSVGIKESFTNEDAVIVLAGTNNVPDRCGDLKQSLEEVLSSFKDTRVIVGSIPYRHDMSSFNSSIFKINRDFLEVIGPCNHAQFVSFDHLHRSLFTRHGLHLNIKGKRKVAEMLAEAVKTSDKKYFGSFYVSQKNRVKHFNVEQILTAQQNKTSRPNVNVWYNSSTVKDNSSIFGNPKRSEHDFEAKSKKKHSIESQVIVNSKYNSNKNFLGLVRYRTHRN